jgi:hypothetical protein
MIAEEPLQPETRRDAIMDRQEQQYARRIADALSERATQGIPATVDVRPAVQAEFASREHDPLWRVSRAPRWRARQVLGVGLMTAMLLTLGLLAAAAPTQAALNARLQQLFGLVLINTQAPPPTAVSLRTGGTPLAAAPLMASRTPPTGLCTPGAMVVGCRIEKVSVAEAQRRVAFPLRLPAWLPDGLRAENADVSSPRSVSVFLRNPRSSAFLQLQQVQGLTGGGYAVDAARVQQVQVNGRPAAYAKGGWRTFGGAWDETINLAYLSWEADGVSYVLHDSGLGLDRQTLIRIAESLR